MSTTVAKRDAVQEIVATIDRPAFQQQLAEMIPPGLSLDTFTRHAKLAIQLNPELVAADRPSLFLAMVKGAASGLLPDGRESAFVVVGKKVQWWAMIAGLRRKAAEHGITLAASVVYTNDEFAYTTMPPSVKHSPTTLGQDRGEPLGAWAAALDADGRMICPPVVMNLAEIDKVKATSRGATSEYSPWVKWWDRMACKTVARRLFAEMPLADQARTEIDRALDAEVDRGSVEEAAAEIPSLANLPTVDLADDYESVEGEVVDDIPFGDAA